MSSAAGFAPDKICAAVTDASRLEALARYDILDTDPEPAFDRAARMAAHLFDASTALVTFIGRDRQWFKARLGFDEEETGLDVSFCAHVVANEAPLIVEDLARDERFADNPYVTEQGFRFYAGVPLRTADEEPIGTLCVLDREPQSPTQETVHRLSDLSAMVEDALERRRETARRRRAERREERQEAIFKSMATGASVEDVLNALCRFAEDEIEEAGVAILRCRDGTLHQAASYALPDAGIDAVDGKAIAPNAGPLGRAAFEQEPLITTDVRTDERWKGHRDWIEGTAIRSCWARPIRGGDGEVLGLCVVFGHASRRPDEEERTLLRRLAHIAGVAVKQEEQKRALRRSEEKFRTTVENAYPIVYVVDRDGTFLLSEGRDLEVLGLEPGEVVGESVYDLYGDVPGILSNIEQALQGEYVDSEVEVDGVVFDSWYSPFYDETGEVAGVVGMAADITERKKQERVLRDGNRHLRLALEGADAGTFEHDLTTDRVHWDERGLDLYGLPPEPSVRPFSAMEEFVVDEDLSALRDTVRRAVEGEDRFDVSFRIRRADDGEVRWIQAHGLVVRDDTGEAERVVGINRDITDRKEKEEALRRQKALLEQTQRLAGAWEVDLRTEELSWSEAVYRIHEVEPGTELDADDGIQFYAPEARPKIRAAIDQCIAEGIPYDLELPIETAEGNRRWVRTVGGPAKEENGEVVKIAGAFQDITARKEAERELRQSRERLRMAVEGGNIGTWDWDLETGAVIFNRQWAEMLGYSREELDFHFSTWEDLVHPDDLERATNILDRYIDGEIDTYNPEIRMRTKDGDWKWIQTIGKVVDRDDDGTVTRAAGIHLDIHDRKQAEQELRHSRERYRSLFRDSTDAILIHDLNGIVQEVNPQAESLFGLEADELRGRSLTELHVPSEAEMVREKLRALRKNEDYEAVSKYERADGSTFWGEIRAGTTEVGDETVVRSLIRDVTERKRAEHQLREERNFLNRILETSPVAIAVLNAEGEFVEASHRAEEILGLEKEEVEARAYNDPEWRIRRPDGEPIPDEELPFAQVMATEEPLYDFEHTIEWPDGTQRLLSVSGAPLHSADGEVEGAVFHMDDITEQREAERALERQNDLFAKAQDIANVGAWEYDVRTGETIVTEQVYHIYGMESDLSIGPRHTIDLLHPEDRPTLRGAFRQAINQGTSYDLELRFTTEEGEQRWVRMRGEPQCEGGDIARLRGTIQDVTDRHRQQAQLRKRRQKLEVLYKATSRLLRAANKDEVADHLIDLIGETLGYSGTTIRFVEGGQIAASRVPDTVRDAMPERPAYAIDGDTPAATAYRTGKTQHFDDLSAARPEFDRGDIRATAYVPMGEYGLISVGSREVGGIGAFDLRLIEILGGYAALILGRLDRMKTLRTAKEAAEEASRIKSALLSNMNHEFRTPLTSIISFSKLIQEDPEMAEPFASRILNGGYRLLRTLNAVMDFAELEGGDLDITPQFCDVATVGASAVEQFRAQAQQNGIDLIVETPDEPVTATLDEYVLERVLVHLVSNAVKFTDEGRVTVTVHDEENHVAVRVSDTGIGIAEEIQPKVFDDFFQVSSGNDRAYQGNGIGLTIAKRMVDRMGGTIDIESTPGEGTTITVRFPRQQT